jgi:hypothetical protein
MFGELPFLAYYGRECVMIHIGLISEKRRRLLSLGYTRLSATGSGKHTAVAPARHKNSFIRNERGAVALEMPLAYLFIILLFLFPLADLANFGFQFISAYQALRNLGQYTMYHVPPDVTNPSSWASSLPSTGYTINTNVYCGDNNPPTACTSSSTVPKYYLFSTNITVAPLVMTVLCKSGSANPCIYTLTYTERFE